jgi:Transposase
MLPYALKLTQIFNTHCNRKTATDKINNWIKMVNKSELNCFDSFINTLEKYKPFILNYFKGRMNRGFVEMVALSRERFRDFPVPEIDSPTREAKGPRLSCVRQRFALNEQNLCLPQ